MLIHQALGKENMFGYKTTLANQMYLLYCIIGNVYYTDKIPQKTKLIWFCSVYISCLPTSISVLLYLLRGMQNGDIVLLIYVVFMIIFVLMESFVRPAIAMFWYRNDIEQMIQIVDEILIKTPPTTNKSENDLDTKKITTIIILVLVILIELYVSVTTLDVIFFYEEEKVKNYMYYLAPFPGVDQFGSFKFYILYFLIICGITSGVFIIAIAHRVIYVPWVVVCHNEAQRIIKELNSLSVDVEISTDNYKDLEPKFKEVMRKCAQNIANLTRFVSTFRGFFETTAGLILSISLYIEVVHALMIVSPAIPFIIKVREFFAFLTTLQEVYTICWLGATLEEMTWNLSFAVYSTPWYWLKIVRKDVYILLCQAQTPINPVALNVYPLMLATFMRFCNVINSTVNVFRAYTQK